MDVGQLFMFVIFCGFLFFLIDVFFLKCLLPLFFSPNAFLFLLKAWFLISVCHRRILKKACRNWFSIKFSRKEVKATSLNHGLVFFILVCVLKHSLPQSNSIFYIYVYDYRSIIFYFRHPISIILDCY